MERRRGESVREGPLPLLADAGDATLAPLPPPPSDSNAPISLSIITPGTGVRVSVNVCLHDTVATLKARAAAALDSPQGQFLRLIASGKMLAPVRKEYYNTAGAAFNLPVIYPGSKLWQLRIVLVKARCRGVGGGWEGSCTAPFARRFFFLPNPLLSPRSCIWRVAPLYPLRRLDNLALVP